MLQLIEFKCFLSDYANRCGGQALVWELRTQAPIHASAGPAIDARWSKPGYKT